MSEPGVVPRVTTIAELDDRLATGFASFEDWIDCLEVCQREEGASRPVSRAHMARPPQS
jgi:hypothetical protein